MAIKFHAETKKSFTFKLNRRDLLILFSSLLAAAIFLIYPNKTIGETFFLSAFLFLLFPYFIIKFVLKENLADFGLTLGNKKIGLISSTIFLLVFIAINYFFVLKPGLRNQLPVPKLIVDNFLLFLWFEIIISLSLHFYWEFFFRGYLQLGLAKKIGIFSIAIPVLAQSLIFGRANWIIFAVILSSSLGASLITKYSRSIVYSFVSMWLISISLDIMIIRYIHQVLS
jgi:membrane protease YdiL (CAAX protease family)